MPRSNSSSYRRYRKRSDSSSPPRRKRSPDSYRSRSKNKADKRSKDKSKKKNYRSTSSSSSSSNQSLPSKPATINLNLLDDRITTNTIDELNQDVFQPKTFSSSASKKATIVSQKVTIDLDNETITVPTPPKIDTADDDDSIIHPQFLDNGIEKWIRKLYNYRQKMANK